MPRRWLALLLPLGWAVRGAQATPATVFTVNSTADAPDANIGNGGWPPVCAEQPALRRAAGGVAPD